MSLDVGGNAKAADNASEQRAALANLNPNLANLVITQTLKNR